MLFRRSAMSSVSVVVLGALAACGSSNPEPESPEQDSGSDSPRENRSSLAVTAEIGALDEGRVDEAFQSALPKLSDCFGRGVSRVPFLSGDVSFEVRVADGGTARAVILKDSTLGDRATEMCMLEALRRASWPSPEGGHEGIAAKSFSFDPQDGTRPPVEWSSSDLGDELSAARSELSACKSGAGPVKATLYVDPSGSAKAVGLSTSDERGAEAAECIIEKLKTISYPSPGSWASKVSFTID
jgi:hypothetical protein